MTAAIASLAFTTGSRGGIVNSSIVSFHQIGLLMIALFYVRISDFSPLFELRNSRNIVAVLLICLVLLSTSASYANSPLNLSGLNYSLERLMQVYLHLLCFIVVCYLCVKECYVGKYFLMAIGISLAVVVLVQLVRIISKTEELAIIMTAVMAVLVQLLQSQVHL